MALGWVILVLAGAILLAIYLGPLLRADFRIRISRKGVVTIKGKTPGYPLAELISDLEFMELPGGSSISGIPGQGGWQLLIRGRKLSKGQRQRVRNALLTRLNH